MMGRLEREPEQLFYSFYLDDAVPDDHLVREIAAVLDLSWVYTEFAPRYVLHEHVADYCLSCSRSNVR